jgi:2-polyprenyl-3-methyl-5-hydroxy-6-metoxy-1,4-benzoquinol methylase
MNNKIKHNKEIVKYGKSSQALIAIKEDFFKNNDEMLSKGKTINKFYSQQSVRSKCKNCDYDLKEVSFSKLNVNYTICKNCGHLNGMHEDTDLFCKKIYTDNKGIDYSEVYDSKGVNEYNRRVRDVYIPKAQFLFDSLIEFDDMPQKLKYADFGAGSGYFVSALRQIGLDDVIGYEPSEQQVLHGNKLIGKDLLQQTSLEDTIVKIKAIDSDVLSMIGVLEHVQNPREILTAISQNKNIKYLYISVPLFSVTVFFEMIFPNIMNRQLSGAHTHLYTESSLKYMAKEFDLDIVASWWFGTDMVDLFRSVAVSLEKNSGTNKMETAWKELFSPMIDPLQLSLDKKHMSSEVHMIFKVNSNYV